MESKTKKDQLKQKGGNTFGEYKFEDWIPEHERQIIKDFWGSFGRNYKNWLQNGKEDERDFCCHGPNPDGFGNPPHGARAIYFVKNGEVAECIEGRYVHCWNNIGKIILDNGASRGVSSCDPWVRVFINKIEKTAVFNKK